MKTFLENVILLAFCLIGASSCAAPQDEAKEVLPDWRYCFHGLFQGLGRAQ